MLNIEEYKKGIVKGVPIALGYLSVSFAFGIVAVDEGLTWWQAVLISITNLTSAGQFAGVGIMSEGGPIFEMMLTQLVINLRYALMSLSLTQKTDKNFNRKKRTALSFFMTDEIFAVASCRNEKVSASYFIGLSTLPVLGWTLGTLLGACMGAVLPHMLQSALGISLYGMFMAIVVPYARENKAVRVAVMVSVSLSCIFRYIPFLKNHISSGFAMIICAVAAAMLAAIVFPAKEE